MFGVLMVACLKAGYVLVADVCPSVVCRMV